MDFLRTPTTDYYDAIAQLQSNSRIIQDYQQARRVRRHRGDVVTAVVCLGCALATLEPATNQWLKASPVGQFFASVKVEQQAQEEVKPEQKTSEIKFSNPHPGARITSRYAPCRNQDKSDCRIHPVTEETKQHTGLDLSIAIGAPILAAADGVVVYTVENCFQGTSSQARNCGGGYGNFVEIQHEYGYSTLYAHLHTVQVQKGMQVTAGQVIGTEGSTGESSGGHLHFEMRRGLDHFDPLDFFPKNTWKNWRN